MSHLHHIFILCDSQRSQKLYKASVIIDICLTFFSHHIFVRTGYLKFYTLCFTPYFHFNLPLFLRTQIKVATILYLWLTFHFPHPLRDIRITISMHMAREPVEAQTRNGRCAISSTRLCWNRQLRSTRAPTAITAALISRRSAPERSNARACSLRAAGRSHLEVFPECSECNQYAWEVSARAVSELKSLGKTRLFSINKRRNNVYVIMYEKCTHLVS